MADVGCVSGIDVASMVAYHQAPTSPCPIGMRSSWTPCATLVHRRLYLASTSQMLLAELFTHIHYVRLVFVFEDAPEFARDLPEEEWVGHSTVLQQIYLDNQLHPIFWTEKRPFLRWWAALKIEESQCPKLVRVTHPA